MSRGQHVAELHGTSTRGPFSETEQCNSSTQYTEVNERIRNKEETEEYFPDGGKEKAPEELREAEINHLPNNEFKVIKMLSGLRRRMDEHSQKFNEELENIKNC